MRNPEALFLTLSAIIFGFFVGQTHIQSKILQELQSVHVRFDGVEQRIDVMEKDLKETQETPDNVIIVSVNTVSLDQVSRKEPDLLLTENEKKMLATLTMAEAEGESELGQRLVIDTVLNRVDSLYFPSTVKDVIYQTGQFTCVRNGRFKRCWAKPELMALVEEELYSRTNNEVAFFRAQHYGGCGKKLFKEGHHYFCKDSRS